jgi:hypothetical protein
MNDLTMTNTWLAILAIVSLVEFLMIAAAGVFAYKVYKQVTVVIETLERVHIAPLRARVDAVLDEVEEITGKVKRAQDTVTAALHTAAGAGSMIADTVRIKSWPILGIIRGVRMAAAMLAKSETPKEVYRPKEVYGSSRP